MGIDNFIFLLARSLQKKVKAIRKEAYSHPPVVEADGTIWFAITHEGRKIKVTLSDMDA